jgi:L-threonylcarbamoyladenylate synthase
MDFYQEIPLLVAELTKGNVILYPTDTIWGLGCDATNSEAIHKIDEVKKRKADKNYIVLLDSYDRLQDYVSYIPTKARNLIEYHTRPLTIIYDQPKNLPPELLAADGSIAIRITKDLFCQELIASFDKPIVSTSANISGEPYPSSFMEVDERISTNVARIADYRRTEQVAAAPSTIVKIEEGKDLIFIRK